VSTQPVHWWHCREAETSGTDKKQSYERRAKLKEKQETNVTAYRATGKPDAAKRGIAKAEKSKEKKEEEDEEEEDDDDE
jgi:hypothetical protein